MNNTLGIILLIVLAIVFIIFGPLITIWSVNLLFGFQIPYTLATWFATVWLGLYLAHSSFKRSE